MSQVALGLQNNGGILGYCRSPTLGSQERSANQVRVNVQQLVYWDTEKVILDVRRFVGFATDVNCGRIRILRKARNVGRSRTRRRRGCNSGRIGGGSGR